MLCSAKLCRDSLRLHGLQPARLVCPWRFSRQEYQSGLPCPPPGDLPNSGIEPRSPTLQADSLPTGPTREAQEYWSGSLSLLQGIFLTHESKQGFLHCRRLLYQLSYQGSPRNSICDKRLSYMCVYQWVSLVAHTVKESACNAGDPSSVPGLGKSSGEGVGYPFQHPCLENSMDKGAWWAAVREVAKSWTQSSD